MTEILMSRLPQPDPKGLPRIKDPALMKRLHREWRWCALCGETRARLSLHHVYRHPRDDVRGNLVMLCGCGTTLCHGKITNEDQETLRALGQHIVTERPDIVAHIRLRLGHEQGDDWILRNLYADVDA